MKRNDKKRRRPSVSHPGYRLVIHSFQQWLEVLGYSQSAIRNYPAHAAEFLNFLETQNHYHLKTLDPEVTKAFLFHWKQRKNKTRGGGLSGSYVNGMVTALTAFLKYLEQTGRIQGVMKTSFERERDFHVPPTVLSEEEVRSLYTACDQTHPVGLRDQAMLAVFYGCGLRKNEGVQLDVSDISLKKGILHVRYGKGSKERKVPIAPKALEAIEVYLREGRDWFLQDNRHAYYSSRGLKKAGQRDHQAFFLNQYGGRMKAFDNRLKTLKEKSGDGQLQTKNFGLHALRHSVATHLLKRGMEVEQIGRFLGHSSLESTQIYTHLAHEL